MKRSKRALNLCKSCLRAPYSLLLSGYMRSGHGLRMTLEQIQNFVSFHQGKTQVVSAPVKAMNGETQALRLGGGCGRIIARIVSVFGLRQRYRAPGPSLFAWGSHGLPPSA